MPGRFALLKHLLIALAAGEAGSVAHLGQAEVGVVLPEQQAVFGAGGHHAVGFVDALGDQIVDQHAGVAVRAGQAHGRPSGGEERGVDAGAEALCGGFFIAGGAVDLPGEVEAGDVARAEGRIEGEGIDAVVLDGVGQPEHAGVLQPGNARVDHALDVLGHRGGHALHIPFVRVESLGFKEDRMAVLVAEADDLVLDRRAVARAGAVDGAGVHRRAVEVVQYDPVRLGRGVGQVADRAVFEAGGIGHERKRHYRLVAVLGFHLGEVDRAAIDARGCAGLEPADGEAEVDQALRQRVGGEKALRAAVPRTLADDDAAV